MFNMPAILVTLLLVATAADASLVNGDFESGNTGFASEYSYAPGGNAIEGEYTISSDPQAWNGSFFAMPDHTTGSGNMMVINGSTASDIFIWEQTVAVDPGTNYEFSAWVSTAVAGGPAELVVEINDVIIGLSFVAPSETGTWVNWLQTWNSGAASAATIRIFDINTTTFPNDFYLDDLAFSAIVPAPAAIWLFGCAIVLLLKPKRN